MVKKLYLSLAAVVLMLIGTSALFTSCVNEIDNAAPVVVDDKPFDRDQYIDASVRPGDDFYRYTNGRWLDDESLPSLIVETEDVLYQFRDQCLRNTTDPVVSAFRQRISDADSYYTADMKLLQSRLDMLSAITTQAELEDAFAQLQQWGYPALFRLVCFTKEGVILPFLTSEKPVTYVKSAMATQDPEKISSSVDIVCKKLPTVGFSQERIAEIRQHAIEVETLEMNAYDEMLNSNTFHKDLTRQHNLTRSTVSTSLQHLAQLLGIGHQAHLLMIDDMDEKLSQGVNSLIELFETGTAESIATLRDYLIYYVLGQDMPFIPQLSPSYDDYQRLCFILDYDYYHTSRIQAEAYGQYVQKEKCGEMMEEIRQVLIDRIDQLDWMTDATKQEALKKARAMTFCIGYPDQWSDEFTPTIKDGSTLLEAISSLRSQKAEMFRKIIGRDMRTHAWDMVFNVFPFTLFNAFYLVYSNQIIIMPGLLMSPIFDIDQSEAAIYATAVIFGHEMSHGFDSNCASFDENGVERNWWTDEDMAAFKLKQQQMITLWNQLEAYPGQPANGEKTLAENIADLGGVTLAYEAYTRRLKAQGFSGKQLDEQLRKFWLSYARLWANEVERDEKYLELQYRLDEVHSAFHNRINGIVRLFDDWYRLFDVKPTDKLYLAPEDRVKIW